MKTIETKPKRRGFAAMDPQRVKEIARMGGRAAHQSGHGHEWDSDGARAAGKRRHELRQQKQTPALLQPPKQ